MACLFCGKEIGPIRILRDKEFCSPKHRKEYKDRLQKVLVQVGEPETIPASVAPFVDSMRPHTGPAHRTAAAFDFSSVKHSAQLPRGWTLEVPETGGNFFARLEVTARDLSVAQPRASFVAEAVPYFGSSIAKSILALPEPKLGAVLLRSLNGQLLSEPIALRYPSGVAEKRPAQLSQPAPLPSPAANLSVPAFTIEAAACAEIAPESVPAPSEDWMPAADPEPALSQPQPSMNGASPAGVHLPTGLPKPAAPPQPASDEFETPPPPFEWRMPSPPAGPVVRLVEPAAADALLARADLRLPQALAHQAPALRPEAHLAHIEVPAPNGVDIVARIAPPPCVPITRPAAIRQPDGLQIANPAMPQASLQWIALPESQAAEREIVPLANPAAVAFPAASLRFAPLVIEAALDRLQAPVEEVPAPAPAVRASSEVAPAAPAALPPVSAGAQPRPDMPRPGFLPLEYQPAAGSGQPVPRLQWRRRTPELAMGKFAVRPIFDRLEDPAKQKDERKTPAFAEIFTMPDAAALSKRRGARHAFTAIAASVTVAMALWFGANAGKIGRGILAQQAAEEIAAAHGRPGLGGSSSSTAAAEPNMLQHPVAWARVEAAKRATVRLGDSFENGMAAWGVKAKALAPGWSRSTDGYVRPGALALFQPTISYTDYRMEFFGQIENKSMSWVVRGKDTQNYYAMKFNITESGLRPMIAMTHYPVIGGKQGHKVEVPLSVMVHNNTPYHVAVDVKGSHYTASIEGQEVDSWSDDTLMAGGVGFFAEAGAKARIYWMKVSKNDDWLGHLCNQIIGGEPQETAWLDRPALPVPQPHQPAPMPASAALWPAETAESEYAPPLKGKGSLKGEMERWSS